MSAHTGKSGLGLYKNGCGELGSDKWFTYANWYTEDSYSGDGCFAINFDTTSGWQGNEYVPVDTSKYYYHSVYGKTLQRSGTTNKLAGGHIGFACYDKNKNFIDLRHCGGTGNTYLSRPASPGDSIIYIKSTSGWYTGEDVTSARAYYRHVIFYPPSHPDYGEAHKYSRLNARTYYKLVATDQGDYAMYLSSYTGSGTGITSPSTLPDWGYEMPAGTPISRGAAGGTYNYCHGAPYLPEEWTLYKTGLFTGESKTSGLPFRYGTKYIKFLNLANYNVRSDSGRPRPKFAFDNIMLVQAKPPNKADKAADKTHTTIKTELFKRRKPKWLKSITRIKSFWKTWRSK